MTRWPDPAELRVDSLGPCRFDSPVRPPEAFVDERERVLLCSSTADLDSLRAAGRELPSFEMAGPRPRLYFDPPATSAAIVTCGGLCPGLNNVIRAIVLRLRFSYGVARVLGFRYGYAGLSAHPGEPPVVLDLGSVERIHELGGTVLGSSRGPQSAAEMVDTLAATRVDLLFVIGGDGGLRGASALVEEISRRGLSIAVIGVPKTIDNDLQWIERSFGFDTAVEAATEVLKCAHAEARAAWNGISLVKLMGRLSGFIAAHATLASGDVNFCLVPEVPFALGAFLRALEERIAEKHHAVIAVAEGAGQELIPDAGPPQRDASGNLRLKDIGTFLRDRVAAHFEARRIEVSVRYIDPSYTIRSLAANSVDAQLCLVLGQHAVHAAMAGRTNMLVGIWNGRTVHIPIPLVVRERKQIDPRSELWERVVETTGQPPLLPA